MPPLRDCGFEDSFRLANKGTGRETLGPSLSSKAHLAAKLGLVENPGYRPCKSGRVSGRHQDRRFAISDQFRDASRPGRDKGRASQLGS